MNHPSETDLERLVVASRLLDAAKREELEAHLQSCAYCGDTYRRFVDLYGELLQDFLLYSSDDVERRVKRPDTELDSLHLVCFPVSNGLLTNIVPRTVALAAEDATVLPRFTHVATLATNDQQVFVNVLRDNERKEYIVQVVADDKDLAHGVLVSFEGSADIHVSDGSGKFTLHAVPTSQGIVAGANIHLPRVSLMVDQEMLASIDRGETVVRDIQPDGSIEISMSAEGRVHCAISRLRDTAIGQCVLVISGTDTQMLPDARALIECDRSLVREGSELRFFTLPRTS